MAEASSSSSQGSNPERRGRNGRRWCFTSFAGLGSSWESIEFLVAEHAENVRFAIWQIEKCPSTGRDHIQGYVRFATPCGFNAVKRLIKDPAAHVEFAKGSEQANIDYCSKSATHQHGPWQIGTPLQEGQGQGARTDLKAMIDRVKEGASDRQIATEFDTGFARYYRNIRAFREAVAEPPRRQPWKTLVLWGPTGIGKSYSCWEYAPQDLHSVSQPGRWWDGYVNQRVILLDDFSDTWGLSAQMLFRVLDPYPLRVEVKGGFVCAAWQFAIITTNLDPALWFSSQTQEVKDALMRRLDIHYCATRADLTQVMSTIPPLAPRP